MFDHELTEKEAFRKHFREMRERILPEEQLLRDADIGSRLLMTPEYRKCGALLLYVSKPREVSTIGLIQAAWANGKTVAVPRTDGDNLRFYRITGWADLEPGAFGISEPISSCIEYIPCETDLCVIPGLGFDVSGYRIGYGKGYYDRWLAHYPGKSAGLCPIASLVLRLPAEPTDQQVQMIVTEQYVRRPEHKEGSD